MDVLIIQATIPKYRVPVFNRLDSLDNIDLTVAHSGGTSLVEDAAYDELSLRMTDLGFVHYQHEVSKLSHNYDVVVSHLSARTLHSILYALIPPPAGLVLWGHAVGGSVLAPIAKSIRKWMVMRADAALFYGDEPRSMYEAMGVPSNKLFVAPNTVRIPNAEYSPEVERKNFLFVGRLRPQKKINEFFRAFAMARGSIPDDVGIEVVGEGEMRDELEAQADMMGIRARIVFHGAVHEHEKLKPIFQRALGYVTPGYAGLGVLHSFAYGVPVITRQYTPDAVEVHNIQDRVNGFLYNGEVGALAQILVELGTHPDRSRQMGQAGYEHYTKDRTVDQMVEGFAEALNYAYARRRSPGEAEL